MTGITKPSECRFYFSSRVATMPGKPGKNLALKSRLGNSGKAGEMLKKSGKCLEFYKFRTLKILDKMLWGLF